MSLSLVLSAVRSKYTPGERTSWDTTTRSVPLMTNVPLSVISGKSPMNTVWLLISPVSLFMNSAVTYSGAAYVTSRFLHSSTEYFGGSKRWSRNDRLIVSEKSSIGEISSKISSSPDFDDTSVRPAASACSTPTFQVSSPMSHANAVVCNARSSGTSRGSEILAKEMRRGLVFAGASAVREAAKRGPSKGSLFSDEALIPRTPQSPSQGDQSKVGARRDSV